MIISGDSFYDIELFVSESNALHCSQRNDGPTSVDKLVIDKCQAAQLVAVLQKWINGEEVE